VLGTPVLREVASLFDHRLNGSLTHRGAGRRFDTRPAIEDKNMKATSTLDQKKCEPCSKNTPTFKGEALRQLSRDLGGNWKVVDDHHLEKEYAFDDFKSALDFTNRVGEIAEAEGHHPDIYLTWGKVSLKIWTHAVDGLSKNDFILAAKADAVR